LLFFFDYFLQVNTGLICSLKNIISGSKNKISSFDISPIIFLD